MCRFIQPLQERKDFIKLNDLLFKVLTDKETFKYLSYDLIPFDRKTIEDLTTHHRNQDIDYIVCENVDRFTGVTAIKRNLQHGFELFLLAVDKGHRRKGLGQQLLEASIQAARKEGYSNIFSMVFADNSTMLNLLIKNGFFTLETQYNMRADGMDVVKLGRKV